MLTHKEQQLLEALEPRAAAEGIELVTLEIVGSRKAPTIRVYIDTKNGVSFDELSSTQAWMGEIMDEIDPFPGAYTLEVSSPGIDRPLRTIEHFERFAGEDCVVKTKSPVNGRSSFSGTLAGIAGNSVVVEADGNTYEIPFDFIKKANVKGKIDFK